MAGAHDGGPEEGAESVMSAHAANGVIEIRGYTGFESGDVDGGDNEDGGGGRRGSYGDCADLG